MPLVMMLNFWRPKCLKYIENMKRQKTLVKAIKHRFLLFATDTTLTARRWMYPC